jgi:hypothetical protein
MMFDQYRELYDDAMAQPDEPQRQAQEETA